MTLQIFLLCFMFMLSFANGSISFLPSFLGGGGGGGGGGAGSTEDRLEDNNIIQHVGEPLVFKQPAAYYYTPRPHPSYAGINKIKLPYPVVVADFELNDELPLDLQNLAMKLGFEKRSDIPSLTEVTKIIGFTNGKETIDFLRDLASTDDGIELIRAFIKPETKINGNENIEASESISIPLIVTTRGGGGGELTSPTGNRRYDNLVHNSKIDLEILKKAIERPESVTTESPGLIQRFRSWATSFVDPPTDSSNAQLTEIKENLEQTNYPTINIDEFHKKSTNLQIPRQNLNVQQQQQQQAQLLSNAKIFNNIPMNQIHYVRSSQNGKLYAIIKKLYPNNRQQSNGIENNLNFNKNSYLKRIPISSAAEDQQFVKKEEEEEEEEEEPSTGSTIIVHNNHPKNKETFIEDQLSQQASEIIESIQLPPSPSPLPIKEKNYHEKVIKLLKKNLMTRKPLLIQKLTLAENNYELETSNVENQQHLDGKTLVLNDADEDVDDSSTTEMTTEILPSIGKFLTQTQHKILIETTTLIPFVDNYKLNSSTEDYNYDANFETKLLKNENNELDIISTTKLPKYSVQSLFDIKTIDLNEETANKEEIIKLINSTTSINDDHDNDDDDNDNDNNESISEPQHQISNSKIEINSMSSAILQKNGIINVHNNGKWKPQRGAGYEAYGIGRIHRADPLSIDIPKKISGIETILRTYNNKPIDKMVK